MAAVGRGRWPKQRRVGEKETIGEYAARRSSPWNNRGRLSEPKVKQSTSESRDIFAKKFFTRFFRSRRTNGWKIDKRIGTIAHNTIIYTHDRPLLSTTVFSASKFMVNDYRCHKNSRNGRDVDRDKIILILCELERALFSYYECTALLTLYYKTHELSDNCFAVSRLRWDVELRLKLFQRY